MNILLIVVLFVVFLFVVMMLSVNGIHRDGGPMD
jgi:hypothetical protein